MSVNFKDTIFLPATDFQMRASLTKKELEIMEHWKNVDIYKRLRVTSDGKRKFFLHDGPPFANGTPHAGTAMNKVLKDIVIRMKQMQGYDAPFVPGWDCHGLPIEWKIEEQLREKGKTKHDVAVSEFRDMCSKFAEYWIGVQREGFKRLGVNGDWENPYLTMDPSNEADIVRCIGKFIVDGCLYRGERPVHWSVVEETALADAEIEYINKKSTSLYVAFEIVSSDVDFLQGAGCVIWTTTPWSIPGNRMIAYCKDIDYSLLLLNGMNGKKIIVAKDLVQNFLETTSLECKLIQNFSGELFAGAICRHPLRASGFDFDVPMFHGDHVEIESGTGLVHTAPEHGIEDFMLGKKHNIPLPKTVGGNGLYHDHVPLFAGTHIFKVDGKMVQALADTETLIFKGSITHSYPHSWRSKAPLIFRTTPQWFISMDNTGVRKKALTEIENVNWLPSQGYNRIKSFIENRGDWCISRQRVWGVPIPLFICKNSGEPLRDPDVIDNIARIFEKEGASAWFLRSPQDFLGDKYTASDYEQNMDTMDVWFESASSHAYVMRKNDTPEFDASLQADLYLEGSDQHRGWFQHSLLCSCGVFENSPFKAVLTHGFIVDEKGKKMSKSLGNVVTLDEAVQNWGADIFRMWVANSDFVEDLKLGVNILKQQEDVYRKIRNTLRYMLGALSGYNDDADSCISEYSELPYLEKWTLHRLTEVECELDSCIDRYDINKYFMVLYNFCASDLSSFFFDIRKDCLYCDHESDPKRRSYRSVLYVLFQHLVRRLAPIMVFTSEEAWLSINKSGSVHMQEFLPHKREWSNPELCTKIDAIREIRKSVTTALEISRKDKVIGSSLQASVTLFDPNETVAEKCADFWKEVTITSGFEIQNSSIPEGAFVGEGLQSIGVVVSIAKGEKCERCWKISSSLKGYICERCRRNLDRKS